MFTFDATPVKFVGLLLLFAWCTAWSLYEVTRPQDRRHRISHALHLGMAVVMLLMVARPTWRAVTAIVPTPVWAAAFGLATAWFGWLTVDAARASDRPGRQHFAGHTLMFAAMTWHLAAMAAKMAGKASGMASSGVAHDMGGHAMAGSAHGASAGATAGGTAAGGAMPGAMGTMNADWMSAQSQPGGVLWWFALAGLPLMAYLLVAAVAALRRAFAAAPVDAGVLVSSGVQVDGGQAGGGQVSGGHSCDDGRPRRAATARMAAASEFAMTGGMFWMSTGLLTPVLPFFALLAF